MYIHYESNNPDVELCISILTWALSRKKGEMVDTYSEGRPLTVSAPCVHDKWCSCAEVTHAIVTSRPLPFCTCAESTTPSPKQA